MLGIQADRLLADLNRDRQPDASVLDEAAREHAHEVVLDYRQFGTFDHATLSRLNASQARYVREQLVADANFGQQAMARNTPAARVNTMLSALSAGKVLTEAEVTHMASGVASSDA